ncbi:hypothetical protein A4X13_0g8873 [Tilletia indica]|uniref:Uncharacterized protein n=1 Tax=Tilletia indica TaxID=43049 RepID=A0A8T8SCK6_9BASI|nr:hypothetical protein A4X13_0g8873 [Tilletia indica]
MAPVGGMCPGRAQCKNNRDFSDLGRHLNATHVQKLVLTDEHTCKIANTPNLPVAPNRGGGGDDETEFITSFRSAASELPSRSPTPQPAAPQAPAPPEPQQVDIPHLQDMTENEADELYKAVAKAPAMLGILPFFMSRDWTAMSDHLAGLYLNNSSGGVRELVRLLCCPKIVLSPLRDRSQGADTLTQRMHKAEFCEIYSHWLKYSVIGNSLCDSVKAPT